MQQRTNDQRNATNGKASQQIYKQNSTQAQRQENSQQGETNSANQSNRTTMDFQRNFPKISNNFTRYDPNSQIDRNKQMNNAAQGNARPPNIKQQEQNISNNVKQGKISEPAPYTVVQSFAARLRYNQSKNEIPIVLNDPIHTTRQGYPVVLLDENDYYVKCCKYTLVGKFTNKMPKMQLVRKSFTLQTQLTGGVKITHFNSRHVYIDLDNEFDYQTVWTKLRMTVEGQLIRIQAWTPDFTTEEETPSVPIWVAVPGVPCHCYKKVLLTTILESVGKVLYLDSPTSQKTRGSTTRVKVQVDLTKKRPEHVWLAFKNSDPNKGRWLKVQYEGIPDYCMYCKHQGHMDYDCTIKRRHEEVNKRKEMEYEKIDKSRGDQHQGGDVIEENVKQNQKGNHQEGKKQETKNQGERNDVQEVSEKEEQLQTQRRKQSKNLEQVQPKTAWRACSPQHKKVIDDSQ